MSKEWQVVFLRSKSSADRSHLNIVDQSLTKNFYVQADLLIFIRKIRSFRVKLFASNYLVVDSSFTEISRERFSSHCM